jgi:hypothetical protein
MLISTKIEGENYIGEYPVFVEGCQHQPNEYGIGGYVDFLFNENVNSEIFTDSYHICDGYQLPFPLPDFSVRAVPSEYTSYYIYVIQDAYYYGLPIWFDRYRGTLDKYAYKSGELPQLQPYGLNVSENGNNAYYHYLEVARFVSKYKYYRVSEAISDKPYPVKPNYKDLVSGYYLDSRTLPDKLKIVPTKTATIELSYYRDTENPKPFLAIEWMAYKCQLVKGVAYTLPIINPVLGTLYISDSDLIELINSINKVGKYPYRFLFENHLPELFSHWNTLQQTELAKPLPPPAKHFDTITKITNTHQTETGRQLRCLAGNNDVWHNRPNPTLDVNPDITHPLWAVDYDRAYQWWFAPQSDGSYGSIIMHNPKIDEIHVALEAQKYSRNELDSNAPRVPTIGHLVEKTAGFVGYRPDDNGKVDTEVQKARDKTQSADIRQPLDTAKYSPYGFGIAGMAIAHLPNDHDGNNPIGGGGALVKDLPNLMLELHGQLNKAIDIQNSSNITFSVGDSKKHYANLSAVIIDIARSVAMMSQLMNTVYTNSLQTESEVREIIGALGLGTTDDSIQLNVNGQNVNLPFKGVDRRESLTNELAEIKLNIGTILGKLI